MNTLTAKVGSRNNLISCIGCGRTPDQIPFHLNGASDLNLTPNDYAKAWDKTYRPNDTNLGGGTIQCDECSYLLLEPLNPIYVDNDDDCGYCGGEGEIEYQANTYDPCEIERRECPICHPGETSADLESAVELARSLGSLTAGI